MIDRLEGSVKWIKTKKVYNINGSFYLDNFSSPDWHMYMYIGFQCYFQLYYVQW